MSARSDELLKKLGYPVKEKKSRGSELLNKLGHEKSTYDPSYSAYRAAAERLKAEKTPIEPPAMRTNALGAGGYQSAKDSRIGSFINASAEGVGAGYANALSTIMDGLESIDKQYREAKERSGVQTHIGEAQEALGYDRTAAESKARNDAAIKLLQSKADDLSARSQKHQEEAKEGLGAVGQFLVDTGIAGTQMLTDVGAAALTGGGSALAPMAVRVFGQGAQEARQAGADVGKQILYGAGSAAVEILTEKLWGGLAGIYGKGFGDDAAKNVTKKLAQKLTSKPAGQAALMLLADMGGEGMEEILSGVANPLLQSIYNEKTPGENYADAFTDENGNFDPTDVLYEGLIGAVLGGLGGAVSLPGNYQEAKVEMAGKAIDHFYDTAEKHGLQSEEAQAAYAQAEEAISKAKSGDRLRKAAGEVAARETKQEAAPVIAPVRASDDVPAPTIAESTEASNEGVATAYKAVLNDTGEETEVKGIASVESRDVTVVLANGETARLDDVSFDDPVTEKLFSTAAAFDTNTAKAYVSGFEGDNVPEYHSGFVSIYGAARNGKTLEQAVSSGLYGNSLSPVSQQLAYNAGLNAGKITDVNVPASAAQQVVQAPAEQNGGVVRRNTGTTTKEQEAQISALDKVFKAIGRTVVIEDTIDRVDEKGNVVQKSANNAYFDPVTNEYHIALDSVGQAYMYFAVHESIHDIKANNEAGYMLLEEAVFDELTRQGEDVGALVAYQMEKFGYDEAAAREEVVANTVPAILTDPETAKQFAERFMDEDTRTVFEKLLDAIRSFLQKAYNVLKEQKSWAQMQAIEGSIEAIDTIRQEYFAALEGATSTDGDMSGAPESSMRLSAKDERSLSIKEQIAAYKDKLNAMNPVANIGSAARPKWNGKPSKQLMRKALSTFFGSYGYSVSSKDAGNVVFDEKAIGELVHYIETDAEFAAVKAAPSVIKKGLLINHHTEHKGRSEVESFTYAAPVLLNGKRGNEGVVVQRTNRSKPHCVRIVLPDGGSFELVQTEKAAQDHSAATAKVAGNSSLETASSLDNISQDGASVKEDTAAPVSQAVSSAKTSIKQVPALFRDKNVSFGKVNIDIGGGKYDLATDYLASIGTENLVFDPYNRSKEVNGDTLSYLQDGNRADTATCANVLNVIAEPEARANVILEAAKSIKPDGRAYFMVYEGDGTGIGKETSSGWQNNRKTASYMDEIKRYFAAVERKGKLIIASSPVSNLPKASWEVQPGKAVLYSAKDSEGNDLTPEQAEHFKDSTVRDRNGNLLVVYHGGTVENEFDTERGEVTQYGKGAYFTDGRYYAKEWAKERGGKVEPYYLNLQNLFDDTGEIPDTPQWKVLEKNLRREGASDGEIKRIKEWGFMEIADFLQKQGKPAKVTMFGAAQLANDALREAGYDGIKGDFRDSTQYVMFSPEQAKRTDNTRPTSSPDVRFSQKDSEGNVLSEQQVEFFKNSKVRIDGELRPMYHATNEQEFTVFSRAMLGENTTGNATDIGMERTAQLGFWFNTQDLSNKYLPYHYNRAEKVYLNITNPAYYYDLITLSDELQDTDPEAFLKSKREDGYDGIILAFDNEFGGISAIAFDENQIKRTSNKKPTSSADVRFSMKENTEIQAKINSAMTMSDAKRMLETTFKVHNIAEYYEGEYKNAEDWLRKVGSSEVEMYIDNEYSLQNKYINHNDDILNEEYSLSDVLDAYLAGTLIGKEKPKATRMDVSTGGVKGDTRFYAPKNVNNAKTALTIAEQRITATNRTAVNQARADVLMFAHNNGAAEALGITKAELNKKLRSWSNYGADARRISEKANYGVAVENRWTGIENCSYVNRASITTENVEQLVESIKGTTSEHERRYIARVMLAADTHIDYTKLRFIFESTKKINERPGTRGRTLGMFNGDNVIVASYNSPNTVAHEMGHYVDTRWGRDLIGAESGSLFLTRGINEDMVAARLGDDGIQFMKNFDVLMSSLTDVNASHSIYSNDPAEVFARFFAKFVEWTDNTATGNKWYNQESGMYGDTFTVNQYMEFVKILQEKAMLDGKIQQIKQQGTEKKLRFSRKDDVSDVDIKALHEKLETVTRERDTLEQQNADLKAQFKLTEGHKVSEKNLELLGRGLLKEYSSTYELSTFVENTRRMFDYIANEEAPIWEDVERLGVGMAKAVIEQSRTLDMTMHEYYADAREYLKKTAITLSPTQRSEAAYMSDSYREYRQSLFGSVNLTNKGLPLEVAWIELSEMHPELFPADAVDGDMPGLLSDAVQVMKPTYINPFGFDMDGAAYDLFLRIYDAYFDIPEVKTFADKKAAEYNALKAKLSNRILQIREDSKARYDANLKKIRKENIAKRQEIARQHKEVVEQEKLLAQMVAGRIQMEERKERAKALAEQKAKLKEQYKRLSDRMNEKLLMERARHQEWKKTDKAQRAQKNEANKLKAKIAEKATALRKMLAAPKLKEGKYVPDFLREPVLSILSGLDFTGPKGGVATQSKWHSAMERLYQEYQNYTLAHSMDANTQALATNGAKYMDVQLMLHDAFLPMFQDFLSKTQGKGDISQLSNTELRALDDILGCVYANIRDVNRLYRNKRFESASAAGDAVITYGNSTKGSKEWRYLNGIKRFVEVDMLDAFSWGFRMGNAGDSIINEISTGLEKTYSRVREASEFFARLKERVGVKDKEIRSWTVATETFKLESGKTVTLSQAQIMELYALNNREQARQHIYTGGIEIANIETAKGIVEQKGSYSVSAIDVAKIVGKLSSKQKALIDGMQKYMSTAVAGWGNETTQELYMIDMYREAKYWTIRASKSSINTEDPAQIRAFNAVMNSSFTKSTNKYAGNPITVGDAFQTFGDHISGMAVYNGLALPIDDAMKWLNYRQRDEDGRIVPNANTKIAIDKVLGRAGYQYLINLIKDLNGLNSSGYSTQLSNKLLSNFKKASVAGKLRVVVQQPVSIFRALSEIDGKYLLAATLKRKSVSEMQECAPIAWWKAQGNYEIGTGRSLRSVIIGDDTIYQKFANAAMKPAGAADDITWSHIWEAVKLEVKAKNKGLTGDAFMEKVRERFSEIVNKTQVVDTIMHRSQAMRSQDLGLKQATAFMSEPTKTYNMLTNAVYGVATAKGAAKKAALKKLAKVGAAWVLTEAAHAAVLSLHDAFRDRDEEERYLDQWLAAFWKNLADGLNPFDLLPYVRDVISAIDGYDTSNMEIEAFAEITDAARAWMKYFDGKGTKTTYGLISASIKALSDLTGAPFGGLLASAEAIINGIAPGTLVKKVDNSVAGHVDNLYAAYKGGYDSQMQKAIANISGMYEKKVKDYIGDGESVADAQKKARSSVLSVCTSKLKPLFLEAPNAGEAARIRSLALKIRIGSKQLYADYDFESNWGKWGR